jgi:hypothetical protein
VVKVDEDFLPCLSPSALSRSSSPSDKVLCLPATERLKFQVELESLSSFISETLSEFDARISIYSCNAIGLIRPHSNSLLGALFPERLH